MILSRSKNILRFILEEKNIGTRELERLSGVSRTTISNMVHEKSEPSIKNCQKIATALNMRVEDIFGVDSHLQDSGSNSISYLNKNINTGQAYKIKLYDSDSIETLNQSSYSTHENYFIDAKTLGKVGYENKTKIDKLIGLYMPDSSMKPEIRKGDILVIDTSLNKVVNNKVYVFTYDGTLYIKKLTKENNNLNAKSFNSKLGILIKDVQNIHVHGRVVFVVPNSTELFVV